MINGGLSREKHKTTKIHIYLYFAASKYL